MKMTFIQVLLARLQSDSPDFYKKLQRYALMAGGLCSLLVAAIHYGIITDYPIGNEHLSVFAKGFVGLVGGTFLTALTGTKDPSLTKDEPTTN